MCKDRLEKAKEIHGAMQRNTYCCTYSARLPLHCDAGVLVVCGMWQSNYHACTTTASSRTTKKKQKTQTNNKQTYWRLANKCIQQQ